MAAFVSSAFSCNLTKAIGADSRPDSLYSITLIVPENRFGIRMDCAGILQTRYDDEY